MDTSNPLHRALESARKDLLDLTARNRLISTRRHQKRSSSIEILDEKSKEIYQILVTDGEEMTFIPAPDECTGDDKADDDDLLARLSQPGDDESDIPDRHLDSLLQTGLTSKTLQGRLLRLFYDARTSEEEQGINLLYLAMGFLRWKEREGSKTQRWAPLLLIPVVLERKSAGSKFQLNWSGDDITTNLSLQAKIHEEFGIDLPSVEDMEDLSPAKYFDQVEKAITGNEGWEVCRDDMVLWLFSFAKFLMYRDLDPDLWPEGDGLEGNSIIRKLLTDEPHESVPVAMSKGTSPSAVVTAVMEDRADAMRPGRPSCFNGSDHVAGIKAILPYLAK